MKITQTVATLSALTILIAAPTVFAQQPEGAGSGSMQQQDQGVSGGGAESAGDAPTGAMGGSAAGGGAQTLSSEQIREAQQALKDKGHDVGSIDGIWGPKTQKAVEDYQQQQGMTASGQLDTETLSSLGVSEGAVGAPGAGEQPSSPEAGGAPGGGAAGEDAGPGSGMPSPDASGAPGGGGASEDAGPGAAGNGG